MKRTSIATLDLEARRQATSKWRRWSAVIVLAVVPLAGCGAMKSRTATEQLLASDAVDRSVAALDFSILANKTVYLDTKYIKPMKEVGAVNSDYIISSLRQQMVCSKCLLQDSPEAAEIIVEARVGALGNQGHEVTYGIPANNALTTAASLVPSAPTLPPTPELSVAKKLDYQAAAKIVVFAYHRETKYPVWQSGISQAWSTAKDSWILGAGPFQRGTIYGGTRFAGSKIGLQALYADGDAKKAAIESYSRQADFVMPADDEPESKTVVAGHEEPVTDIADTGGDATPSPAATSGHNGVAAYAPLPEADKRPVRRNSFLDSLKLRR